MKFLILATLGLLSMNLAMAAKIECPSEAVLELRCTADPKSGDGEVAIGLVKNLIICKDKSSARYGMFIQSPGATQAEGAEVAKVERMGATSYEFSVGKTKFALSQSMAARMSSRFTIYMPREESSVNLKCK